MAFWLNHNNACSCQKWSEILRFVRAFVYCFHIYIYMSKYISMYFHYIYVCVCVSVSMSTCGKLSFCFFVPLFCLFCKMSYTMLGNFSFPFSSKTKGQIYCYSLGKDQKLANEKHSFRIKKLSFFLQFSSIWHKGKNGFPITIQDPRISK